MSLSCMLTAVPAGASAPLPATAPSLASSLAATSSPAPSSPQTCEETRVLSLGGSVTEIIYALGMQDQLIGTDLSSVYPEQAQKLASVGYYRSLPVEGILRLKPNLVIASEQAGPVRVLDQLRALGLRVHQISDQPSLDSLHQRIGLIADLLCVADKGQALKKSLDLAMQAALQIPVKRQSVMVLVIRAGKLLGAGSGTHAAKILELSGVDNALTDQTGYRQVSAEIVSARMPSAMIVTSLSVQAMGGLEAIRQHPLLAHTPASIDGRLIELDDLMAQGMGLRLPQAIERIRTGLAER